MSAASPPGLMPPLSPVGGMWEGVYNSIDQMIYVLYVRQYKFILALRL